MSKVAPENKVVSAKGMKRGNADMSKDNAVFVMNEVPGVYAPHETNGQSSLGKKEPLGEIRRDPSGSKLQEMLKMEDGAVDHTLIGSKETVTLSWQHVNAFVKPPNRMCCRGPDLTVPTKQVLRDVYGIVQPGNLMAIIGASGAGKTTLLNTLTSRANNQQLTINGDIRVNGVDIGTGIRNISAYVQQDDLFVATMTVREHLIFRALLRMEKELSQKVRLQRVEDVIKELGLTKCADNIIGNPSANMKGISGGEMRRLSFATEILTNPPLLFCDEPTSGLDSYMAENIVLTLRNMAAKGKTIICTIHQPSSEVFALFNSLLIMAEGRVAFMGKYDDTLDFYKSQGYPCPQNFNPADFYIKTMAVVPDNETECKKKIEAICDGFSLSQYRKVIASNIDQSTNNPHKTGVIFEEAFASTSRYEAPWHRQFANVFKRSWKTTYRDANVLRVKIGQTVIMSLMVGLIYLQLDIDQTGVQDVNGVLFLLLINISFTNLFSVLTSFPGEVPVFMRDYANGLYRTDVYFMCKSLAELPGSLVISFAYCAITYWMVGLYGSGSAFITFVGISLLTAVCSMSCGYIVSTAANSSTMAIALAPPLMVPLIMFGGFFLNSDSIPVYFIWLEYLSWFKYSNELVSINQWENVDSIGCSSYNASASCNKACPFDDGASVISYQNFNQDNKLKDVLILVALTVGYRFIAFLILFVKARRAKG